ncbi:Rapamycininsensitive companion of mTORlike [Caligus rogercresseyi]|uniref:Rapamycininsensitive companion of mTORlike n=1 Tax=Caligus rogercresseyi TaxID=217165 RepID=A0A7T8JYY0_CALRO|nr:Rapamycininsensitive companion of mTORlike [Caligus rogercresseyi]
MAASGYVYPLGRSGRVLLGGPGKRRVEGLPGFRTRFLENQGNNDEEEECDLLEGGDGSLRDNVLEALRCLSSRGSGEISKGKSLAYLNGLVKVLSRLGKALLDEEVDTLGLRIKEIMLW